MSDDLRLEDKQIRRRQRVRNLVLLVVLLGLAALFYAIAVVKFRVSG
ncbi:MAG TPA: hypothetical protein VE650_20665 [Acetobacteraceae bacterium]|nr:hypothetical protein [Acetobacteraceae bacterium]